jgi:thiamine biosynthesis lipoprotein
MGTRAHVLVVGGPAGLVRRGPVFLADLEARWSRFREDSEVSLMNRAAGEPVPVSALTVAMVERAIEGARVTDGRFDPTLLGAVIRAGYDRTFELLPDGRVTARSDLASGWRAIRVDAAAGTVTMPHGVGFDAGGIGKGFAADLLVADLMAAGARGACVSIGGDVRVEGDGLNGPGWTVAVEHPFTPDAPAALIGLAGGAVATSTRAKRMWGPDDDRRHHLIDPATGLPAINGLLSATAVTAEAWQAEVLAKAAFVAGIDRGLAVLVDRGADGLLIGDAGDVHVSDGFGAFTDSSMRAIARSAS